MRKKWIILASSILVIIAGVFIYLKYRGSADFEPLIKEKLQQVVKEGSDSLYNLDIDRIRIDVIHSQVTIENATLDIDSLRLAELDSLQRAPNDVYKISLKNLVIDGIGPQDILKKNSIDLNVLYINEPVVEIFHHKRAYNYTPPDTTTLYKKIAKEIGHCSINDLIVQKIDFRYYNVTNENKLTHLKNVTVNFKDILIDSTTQNDSTRFLYAKGATIFLKDYNMATPDSLYNFHVDSLSLDAGTRKLDMTQLSLKPRGKKEDFSKKLRYYKDRYDIKVESASIQNIDWWQLLSEEGFTAKQMELRNGNIDVFADRTLPDPHRNRVGNYPHQLLMRLKLPVMIEHVNVKNFKVNYTELNNKTLKRGSVIFDDINGAFTNVTNRKEMITKNRYFSLDANSKLMSAGPLHAVFKFDLADSDNGTFSLDVEVGNMDGKILNAAAKTLGLFEIKNAQINKIAVHMNASNYSSRGTVAFFYKDLEVEVLKPDEENNNKLKKRGFISFLANNFIIQKSNTGDDENRDPKRVTYKRDSQKSFFNLIWKTIFTGLGATVKGENK